MRGDFVELRPGDHDATMEDIGEKGRPPGDPPDVAVSWAKRVTGGLVGGMSAPEDVLDEGFVRERMSLVFPDGRDGEPDITIEREVLEAMNGLWKRCIIVKVLGRNVSLPVLTRRLRELWKPNGAMHVMDLPRQYFMIRFAVEEEYMAALTGGPWRAFGSYITLQAWSPDFDPLKDDIVTTPVWVRLSHLPVNFYHKTILMGIAEGLGNPIKVDTTTLSLDHARFARVCVEVDLKKPLKGTVRVNGDRYFVSYEGLTNICSSCGLYGHLMHTCPRVVAEKSVQRVVAENAALTVPPSQLIEVRSSGNAESADGFTAVRNNGRRPTNASVRVVFAAGGADAARRGKVQDPKIQGDTGNITVSNRFGSLEEDMVGANVEELIRREGENKDNENLGNQANIGGKSIQSQARGFVLNLEKGKGGPTGRDEIEAKWAS